MRKQTKIVAVASAAALLAIGASMTAFAAQGWVQEDNGTWYFYDRDENRVTDEWKRSGDNWYWLDGEEDGAMAVDKLVEDDNDTYYVDTNGVMVRNTWVKVINEDQDDDSDPAEYNYYYMQSNGKAYKGNGNGVNKKTIDGKRYAFDEDGKMLYGWVNDSGEMVNGEDEWVDGMYYFGNWDDGAMKTGWQQIYVHDDRADDKDDDYYYWFNFKSNGQRRESNKKWKSNGKYYGFDDDGVMIYQWFELTGSDSNASGTTTANWRYYNSPEDGARATKGWFKVVPPTEDNSFLENEDTFASEDSNDESERWYYADSNGKLAEGEIKSIKGKYYGFWPDDGQGKAGRMLTGLCVLQMKEDSSTIEYVVKDDMDSDYLDGILDGTNKLEDGQTLYYFGNDEDTDGVMKTGNVNINLDGNAYSFFFKKNGSASSGRGAGVSGIDDKKYIYMYGCRIKADSDDKYQLVKVNAGSNGNTVNSEGVTVEKIDPQAFTGSFKNKDDETVNYVKLGGNNYYLVNTSGNIQKNKSAAKDGNDCYYYVDKNMDVRFYTDMKSLKGDTVKGNSLSDLEEADL